MAHACADVISVPFCSVITDAALRLGRALLAQPLAPGREREVDRVQPAHRVGPDLDGGAAPAELDVGVVIDVVGEVTDLVDPGQR